GVPGASTPMAGWIVLVVTDIGNPSRFDSGATTTIPHCGSQVLRPGRSRLGGRVIVFSLSDGSISERVAGAPLFEPPSRLASFAAGRSAALIGLKKKTGSGGRCSSANPPSTPKALGTSGVGAEAPQSGR